MAAEAPRSGGTVKVQCRFPKYLVKKMDDEITDEKKFSTRSEWLRHLAEEYFNQKELIENLDAIVEERISEGRYDEALKKRVSEIISSQFRK